MKFYSPLGKELTLQDFINYYSDAYYTGKANGEVVKNLHKNSEIVDNEMEKILSNGIKTELDVINILAWKIGKLKLKESTEEHPFVYHKDWKINEISQEYKLKRYGKDFPIQEFAKYIVENINDLQQLQPQEILDSLNKSSIDYIGTVYFITILYFISKAKYPIYDKFAWLALQAINREENPENTVGIKYKELPSKETVEFCSICEKEYADYIRKLKEIFGEDYKTNRDIDRALWAYGHLFKCNKSDC